jgi:hypothetical protein
MSQQLITYSGDRRLVLANGEAIRQPVWFSSWNRIRIGLLFSIDRNAGTSNITGTPVFAFGLCAGTSNVFIAGTSTHVIGVRNVNPTWTYQAGPPKRYESGSNGAYRGFKKVGTTYTDASAAFGNSLCALPECGTPARNAMILEITKGTPNYGMKFWTNNATGAQADVSNAAFEEAMIVDDMVNVSGVSGIGGGAVDAASKTLAVAEGTDGAFTHLFVYWERVTQFLTFNIRHRKMA